MLTSDQIITKLAGVLQGVQYSAFSLMLDVFIVAAVNIEISVHGYI